MLRQLTSGYTNLLHRVLCIILVLGILPAAAIADSPEQQMQQELAEAADDSTRADILIQLCDYYTYTDGEKGLVYASQLKNVAGRSGNFLALARAWEREGNILFHMGRRKQALSSYLQAHSINTRHVNDYEISASVMYNVGNVHIELGNLDSAIFYAEKAGEIFLANSDSMGYGATLYLTIGIYNDMGLYARAMKNGLESLQIFRNVGNHDWEMYSLNSLVDLYSIQGEYEKGLAILSDVIQYYRNTSNHKFESVALRFMGDIYMMMKQDSASAAALTNALEISRNGNFLPEEVKTLYSLATLRFQNKNFREAQELFTEGLEKSIAISDGKFIASNLLGLGKTQTELNNITMAVDYLHRAITRLQQLPDPVGVREGYLYLSMAYEQQGNTDSALQAYKYYAAQNDSIRRQENSRQLKELSYQYEFEQKEQQIESLTHENQLAEANRKNLWLFFSISIILLLSAVSLLYLRNRKNKQLLEKEKEIDRVKSRFFANISHEFRTPLTLILSPLFQLKKEAALKPFLPVIGIVEDNARRLLHLVNQILELSRLDAGRNTIHAREVKLSAYLNKVFASYYSYADSHRITFKKNFEMEDDLFIIDENKLETVLNNLLSNAIKYEPNGGHVKFTAKLEPGMHNRESLVIEVWNKGSYIPADDLAHIFDRFYRGQQQKRETHVQGTGIGLALTKEVVRLMGGEIHVESQKSNGTLFRVTLPRAASVSLQDAKQEIASADENSYADMPESRSASTKPAGIHNQLHVLVVDDHAEIRDFIAGCLQHEYRVHMATDGDEGRTKALQIVPDLIISDVMMPGTDGYSLTHQLKSDEKTSHIPIILLSAGASSGNKLEGLKKGADDYLVKPFNTEELKLRVANLIESRQNLRKKYTGEIAAGNETAKTDSIEKQFLHKVHKCIEENLANEEFTIEELAENVGMSRSQLHRKLIALTSLSASNYVKTYRLKRAHELILNNAGTIAEICYMSGFSSPSYFSKSFRELYGVTPGELKSA